MKNFVCVWTQRIWTEPLCVVTTTQWRGLHTSSLVLNLFLNWMFKMDTSPSSLMQHHSYWPLSTRRLGDSAPREWPSDIPRCLHTKKKKMNMIREKCPDTLGLIDDVIIYGKMKVKHDRNLHNLLKITQIERNCFNSDKCAVDKNRYIFSGQFTMRME